MMMSHQIPPTINGMNARICISAMQKMIRQANERRAAEFAFEMINTSKNFCSWACNRLEVITHEDIDCVNHPIIVPFVSESCRLARERWEKGNPCASRMFAGNAIRLLCRTPKSREGDHFQAAIGLKGLLTKYTPQIPDEALDKHTAEGRRLGRGLDHWINEGAKLAGDPPQDQYFDEAYQMWTKQAGDCLFTQK